MVIWTEYAQSERKSAILLKMVINVFIKRLAGIGMRKSFLK